MIEYGTLLVVGLLLGLLLSRADLQSLSLWTALMAAATLALALASVYQAWHSRQQSDAINQQLDLQRQTLELQAQILKDQMRPMLVWADYRDEYVGRSPRSTFWVKNIGRSTATVLSAGFLPKKGRWLDGPVHHTVPPGATIQVLDAPCDKQGTLKVIYQGPLGDEHELSGDYHSIISDLRTKRGEAR